MTGFAGVPPERWLAEARLHTRETAEGLRITYDPALRDSFLAAYAAPPADLWPQYDALAGVPVAVIRGANSDLLSADTVAEMRRRRPDLIVAEVPDRAHIPFLDETEAVSAIKAFLVAVSA
jgi:pimeloyl-ACP methyl ester carboxylesterase